MIIGSKNRYRIPFFLRLFLAGTLFFKISHSLLLFDETILTKHAGSHQETKSAIMVKNSFDYTKQTFISLWEV